jgi:hypothetical protein
MSARKTNSKNTRIKRSNKHVIPKGLQLASEKPVDFSIQSQRVFKLRAQASSSYIHLVTWSNLASFVGVIAASSTTSVYLSNCIRLRKIELWAPVQTAGTAITSSITWTSSAFDFESPPITRSDSSISYDHPAYLCVLPPRGSVASKWHRSDDTTVVYDMRCPVGTTVDFTFDWVLSDSATTQAQIAGPALSGATAGIVYHKTLAGASGSLVVNNILNAA